MGGHSIPYIDWCNRNRKRLLHGFKIHYGGDLSLIDHKRIKNVEHYNNCKRYIDVYEDVKQVSDDDTVIDEIPANQMALPEYQAILSVSEGSMMLVTEERSGATESYIYDCVTPKPNKRSGDDFIKQSRKRRMVHDCENLSSVQEQVCPKVPRTRIRDLLVMDIARFYYRLLLDQRRCSVNNR